MAEINEKGVKLDSPYGELELRFGRPNYIVVPEENIDVPASPQHFVEIVEKLRNGNLAEKHLDLLRKTSGLLSDWSQTEKVRRMIKANTEKDLTELREDLNSKLEEIEEKQQRKEKFKQVWNDVREAGYYIRKYRGAKIRYLLVCGEFRRDFFVFQLPPEYDFRLYKGKPSTPKTLGRRLEKSPSELIKSHNPNREKETFQDLQDDEEASKNLRKAFEGLPEPQREGLERGLVALRLGASEDSEERD